VERVLVCLLASTRAHQLTFPSFKRQVLDELDADLALALAIDENYDYANPFWQHAKYRWTAPDYSDVGNAFDLAQRWLCQQNDVPAPDWRTMLQVRGIWQGGIRSANPEPTASSILPFSRWLLLRGLQQDGILDRYDRFVISRSDFVWLCPHPPLSLLDREAIWVPDGEYWGGLPDRHLVVSRADVVNCLNLIEEIVLHPSTLYEEMKHQKWWNNENFITKHQRVEEYKQKLAWNNEQFLAQHLERKGLLDKVKLFPYVMYTARPIGEHRSTWSPGSFEPAVGHYVKYPGEFRAATAYKTIIRNRVDWESGIWMQFDPRSVAPPPPASLLRRLRFTCQRAYYERAYYFNKFVSALTRSGRIRRITRFCKKMLQPIVRTRVLD
jgi:hypothetical protein